LLKYSLIHVLCVYSRSEPYDPYIPNNSQRGADNAGGNNKTARVQQQVDEVVGIMQENIDKAMQRGERLDDLRGKTGKYVYIMCLYDI
jgi:hypothetical protein